LIGFVSRHFPGDWVRVVREASAAILKGDRPTRLWAAIHPGKGIVGFAHFEGERFGPIGVAESERGQGIGQVLTLNVLRSQREAGYRSSWFLWSDDRTADRLYRHFGFREIRRFALLRKELQ
ncbi:MAG TPA: GNAT family N-acetyltransferase, partial [Fimbriimonas sp.]